MNNVYHRFEFGQIRTQLRQAVVFVYKKVKFSLYQSIFTPALGAVVMGFILLLIRRFLAVNLTSVWLISFIGLASYMITMYILVGSSIFHDAKRGFNEIFKK